MKWRVLQLLAAALLLTGCASIINGRSQSVAFDSTPTGADLAVGGLKATTPAKLTLTRSETYTAIFTKADFPNQTVQLVPRGSWWLLGNLAFGGLIGIIIDLATGSGMTLSPDEVHMDMASGVIGPVITKTVDDPQGVRWSEQACRRIEISGHAAGQNYRNHCAWRQ